jgi:drug/metabolite transporter (DMT)-like permease
VWWNYLTKSSQSPKNFSLLKGTVLMGVAVGAIVTVPMREVPIDVWAYVCASGVVHMLYILSLSSAYETGDISYVYPIARSAPAFVPLAAFVGLGETISLQGGIGILIVVVAIFVLQMRGHASREFRQLWASLRRRDSRWAFATLGTVVTYTIIDKAGMVSFSRIEAISAPLQGPFYFLMESALCYLLFWLYMQLRTGLLLGSVWRQEWPKAVAAALGTMASYSLILYVMRSENVSYIVALRQSSVFLAVLVGWLALKEEYGKARISASAAMIVGFYLVTTAR